MEIWIVLFNGLAAMADAISRLVLLRIIVDPLLEPVLASCSDTLKLRAARRTPEALGVSVSLRLTPATIRSKGYMWLDLTGHRLASIVDSLPKAYKRTPPVTLYA